MTTFHQNHCKQSEVTCAYAAQILPESEVAAAEAHIAACPDCQRALESLRGVVGRFVSWPTDVLRPPTSLQGRLALRIAEETGKQPVPPPARQWSEPEWEQVAPGIECKLLATDTGEATPGNPGADPIGGKQCVHRAAAAGLAAPERVGALADALGHDPVEDRGERRRRRTPLPRAGVGLDRRELLADGQLIKLGGPSATLRAAVESRLAMARSGMIAMHAL